MEDLHYNGILYCESMQYFASLPGERGDIYETAYKINNEDVNAELLLNGKVIKDFGILRMHGRLNHGKDKNCGKLFCLSNFDLTNLKLGIQYIPLNKIFQSDADCCVIIHKVDQFLKRIMAELEKLGIEHERNFVEYFDPHQFNGVKTKFQKPLRHQSEKEFRLWFDYDSPEPLRIKINMRDISDLWPSDTIMAVKRTIK